MQSPARSRAHDSHDAHRSQSETVKVRAENVERHFVSRRAAVHALGPASLSIHDGEFICLVGPSGCGKSTLLRIVAGLLQPSAGLVSIQHENPTAPLSAMVFQDYSIFPWKSVAANVRFGLEMAGVRGKDADARVERWLTKLGLADFADAFPATLSGGMRQRVSIARALAVEPEILLMDEPFAALDAQLRRVLQDELLALWQEDRRTVLFVTHSLDEAVLLADRVCVMGARPGTIIREYEIPFPRPRATDLRGSAEFARLEEEIWGTLRGEVEEQ